MTPAILALLQLADVYTTRRFLKGPNLHRALHELLKTGHVEKRGGGLGKRVAWRPLKTRVT